MVATIDEPSPFPESDDDYEDNPSHTSSNDEDVLKEQEIKHWV